MLPLMAMSFIALSPQEPTRPLFHCELAPSMGTGRSSEGGIDIGTEVSMTCGLRVLTMDRLSIWPSIRWSDARWTVYSRSAERDLLKSFQSRGLGYGFEVQFARDPWVFLYSLHSTHAQGSFEQSYSTSNARQSLYFASLEDRQLEHELGFSHPLSEQVAWTASVLWNRGNESWDPSLGSYSGETVSRDKKLSLTSNPANLTGPEPSDHAETDRQSLKVGVRILFH